MSSSSTAIEFRFMCGRRNHAASKLTKGDLANYFLAVTGCPLPQIAGRPLSIVRCPRGSTKPCFFQKHVGSGLPDGVDAVPVPDRKTGATGKYITASTAEGLVGLAQMGVLEIHPWGSRNDSLEKSDRIIFDLDPDPSIPWKVLAESALRVRALLQTPRLQSFLKSTGGKVLHVVVPCAPSTPGRQSRCSRMPWPATLRKTNSSFSSPK